MLTHTDRDLSSLKVEGLLISMSVMKPHFHLVRISIQTLVLFYKKKNNNCVVYNYEISNCEHQPTLNKRLF